MGWLGSFRIGARGGSSFVLCNSGGLLCRGNIVLFYAIMVGYYVGEVCAWDDRRVLIGLRLQE